jgi:hypothetical protein
MNLEEQLLKDLAAEVADAMDKEIVEDIMIDVLTNDGWIETKINPAFDVSPNLTDWYAETAEWCHLNAQGDYRLLKGQWLFEDPEDATMFVLRWR